MLWNVTSAYSIGENDVLRQQSWGYRCDQMRTWEWSECVPLSWHLGFTATEDHSTVPAKAHPEVMGKIMWELRGDKVTDSRVPNGPLCLCAHHGRGWSVIVGPKGEEWWNKCIWRRIWKVSLARAGWSDRTFAIFLELLTPESRVSVFQIGISFLLKENVE